MSFISDAARTISRREETPATCCRVRRLQRNADNRQIRHKGAHMDSANSQSAISVPDHFQKGSSTTERYSYTPTCSDLSYLAENNNNQYRSRRRVLAFPRLLGLSALIVISPLLTIASSGGASAVFQRLDTATQGNWRGAYGADGFNVIGDSASVPAYVTATPAGNSSWVWTSSTSDTRALQKA